ncbi:Cell division protein FtsH [Minicystis rosea]|nr:Cell division protein FtsH [Minicystis rosea]
MFRSTHRNLILTAGVVALAAACSAGNSNNVFTGSTGDGAGGAGHGGSGSTGTKSTGTGTGDVGGGNISFTTSGTGTGTGNTCNHAPDADGDGDGWTANEGDCNDCDPNVNPGAVEVVATDPNAPPADENCDGMIDNVDPTCDDGLALADVDANNGARALDLCKFTEETPASKKDKTWGVISSKYVRANGTQFSPGLQVGLEDGWGPNVHVQGGKRMLVLSSGHSRLPGQNGSCDSLSCTSNSSATAPPNFPQDNPSCPPSASIKDDVGIELRIRTPTNATGYSFNFKFYSFEYAEWVCNDYNDQFIALVNPPPAGSINGNISFDSMHNPVSVNLGFFDVCDPALKDDFAFWCESASCPYPPNPYCPSGTAELAGTGFDTWDDAGATSWLKSQAPVKGGDIITVRFAMWDTGDQNYDSTTLIDNWQWIANGGTVVIGTDPIGMPK